MPRLTIDFPPALYDSLLHSASVHGRTPQEEIVAQWTVVSLATVAPSDTTDLIELSDEEVRNDPLIRLAGFIKGGERNLSMNVDAILAESYADTHDDAE